MIKLEVTKDNHVHGEFHGTVDDIMRDLCLTIQSVYEAFDEKTREYFKNGMLGCLTEVAFADNDEEEEEKERNEQIKSFNALFKAIMDLSELDPRFKKKADDAIKQWNALHPDQKVESFKELYEESREFIKKGMN